MGYKPCYNTLYEGLDTWRRDLEQGRENDRIKASKQHRAILRVMERIKSVSDKPCIASRAYGTPGFISGVHR